MIPSPLTHECFGIWPSSSVHTYYSGLHLHSQVRVTMLSQLLWWWCSWQSPSKELQNPECSPTWVTGMSCDSKAPGVKTSRVLKICWRKVPSHPASQQVVLWYIKQSNHMQANWCFGAQSLHCFPWILGDREFIITSVTQCIRSKYLFSVDDIDSQLDRISNDLGDRPLGISVRLYCVGLKFGKCGWHHSWAGILD